MSQNILPHPSLVERLAAIARRLRKLRRPSEAAELLEVAAALSPNGAQLREEAKDTLKDEGLEDFDREFKRRNLEASHALGMAHVFENRGEFDRAVAMTDLAKLRTPFNYLAYTAAAFLHLRHRDPASALQEFSQARRLNPLDYKLAVETSRCALETENFEIALENAVDAMLLSAWRSEQEQEQERRRIQTLTRLCGRTEKQVRLLEKKRAHALQKACDHVALSQAHLFSTTQKGMRKRVPRKKEGVSGALLQQANDLRSMELFQHFGDQQLIQLAGIMREDRVKHAQVIFREAQEGRDLYLIRKGGVHIARRTPVGTQILSSLAFGSLFGEVAFLDRQPRSATAFGVGNSSIYVIPAAELDVLLQDNRDLAVSLLWSFWQTLAGKVRSSNSQMNELFSATGVEIERATSEDGEAVEVSTEEKLSLLREQGLSAKELELLAKYSDEEHFKSGALIFGEGEEGHSLYIVLRGKVRISRMVPGMGEECLSILDRGEVFGEMALIDAQPRSADARAHTGGCTVFSISRKLIEEVLSMDPDAAYQFLSLLCRLLCSRLRSMNERLVAWKTMASHE